MFRRFNDFRLLRRSENNPAAPKSMSLLESLAVVPWLRARV